MEGRIEFRTARVESGWSDFTVSLGESSWKCRASYISAHPLVDMIHTAVDLYDHIFVAPMPEESSTWDITACDEPGGLLIRIVSIEGENRASVFRLDDQFKPQAVPVGEGTIDYWQFADAVFSDAARTVARYGFIGFRDRWFFPNWDRDYHYEALPIEHFLYLAALIERRKPVNEITLADEIGLLRKIQKTSRDPRTVE
ncbi:MAG TPA: hypothetical protein VFX38_03805 [Gammaproteobacteria bacterium]|nr:hypothetical protein [Gammaproteobacteria bacterium]